MDALVFEIHGFLVANGFDCVVESCSGQSVLRVGARYILPWPVRMTRPEDARRQSVSFDVLLNSLSKDGGCPVIITEDRWRRQGNMMRARLLAHLESFTPVYARNCQVRKIDKKTASVFLEENHSYGDASCRYRYGLFLKRHTGRFKEGDGLQLEPGSLVAVASFSNARKWRKGDKVIGSYEWTRYASLPGVRVNGGMGKLLKAFIMDVNPDDVMSYADREWSEGAVYEKLGFTLEGNKAPVMFEVDGQWRRTPLRGGQEAEMRSGNLYLQNLGSNKYRLKLTQYE